MTAKPADFRQIAPVYYMCVARGANLRQPRLPEDATWAAESHTSRAGRGPYGEIPTYYYNFKASMPPFNAPALNLSLATQKQRVREIF